MDKKIYLKPAPEMKVRNPVTGAFLPECGAWVTNCSYWMRRKKEGSVVEAAPPKTTKKENSK